MAYNTNNSSVFSDIPDWVKDQLNQKTLNENVAGPEKYNSKFWNVDQIRTMKYDLQLWNDSVLKPALIKRLQNLVNSGEVTLKNNSTQVNFQDVQNLDALVNFKDGETKQHYTEDGWYRAWKSIDNPHFQNDLKSLDDLTLIDRGSYKGAQYVPQNKFNEDALKNFEKDKESIKHIGDVMNQSIDVWPNKIRNDMRAYEIQKNFIEGISVDWREGIKPYIPQNKKNDDQPWWIQYFGDPSVGVELGTWDDFKKGFVDGLVEIPKQGGSFLYDQTLGANGLGISPYLLLFGIGAVTILILK